MYTLRTNSMTTIEQLEAKLNTDYEIILTILPKVRRQGLHLTVKDGVMIIVSPHPEHHGLEDYLNGYIRQYVTNRPSMNGYDISVVLARLIGREIVRYFHRLIIDNMQRL